MAVAFYIPSVDEDGQIKPNQAYQQQQQQQQQQHGQQQQQESGTSPNVSQQVCSGEFRDLQQQHLMLLFHEILLAYASEAILAQRATTLANPSPCLLCKKLYYLFRRIY